MEAQLETPISASLQKTYTHAMVLATSKHYFALFAQELFDLLDLNTFCQLPTTTNPFPLLKPYIKPPSL